MVDLLKVGVFHAGDIVIMFYVCQRHGKEREGLCQDNQPHTNANIAYVTDFSESAETQRQDHSDKTVYTQAGHEIDSCIGVDIKNDAWDLTQCVPHRPVEAHTIVYNPQRQRQGEKDVWNDQVERVQGGGVDLLHVGTDDVESEAVTQ